MAVHMIGYRSPYQQSQCCAQCFISLWTLEKHLAGKLYPTLQRQCLLLWDISLGTVVGQMLRCQWWLRGVLMCTICFPHAMCSSKSQ
jgi:hypothetical protein